MYHSLYLIMPKSFLLRVVILIPSITFLSWFILRLAQDFYHWLAHTNCPGLKWLHNWHMTWHHRIYSKEYKLRVSYEELCKAHWYNEIPEAIFMLLAVTTLITFLWLLNCPYWWSAAYGLYHAGRFHLIRAIKIGLGDIDLWYQVTPEHQTAFTANEDGSPFFKTPLGRWKVNALYHLAHHDRTANAYFCAAYPWLDWAFKTAYDFQGLSVAIAFTEKNSDLAQSLQSALPLNERQIYLLPSS
jgi:monoglucosyldiacylglycerol epimerase